MALNNLGLGFMFTAKDLASGVMQRVQKNFMQMEGTTSDAAAKMGKAFSGVTIGASVMAVGLGGLAMLGGAVTAASDFATAVAKVQTIADAAAFPLNEIKRIGHEMGSIYGGDLTTQMGALYSAIGSGAESAADAVAVMHSANVLAIGGLTTTDIAMTGLMGTLNGFGMGLQKANDVADSFFQAVKIGGSDLVVGTLTNALGRVVPTASALGVQLDELTGSIARMTQVGIKTDEAVTGMKAILDQIIKPSSDATAEAARMGVKFNMHAIKMAGGFQKFVNAIVANPKFNKDTIKKLFGSSSEALNAFLALSSEGGAKFNAVMTQMAEKTGIAQKAFNILKMTPEQLGKVLKTNLQSSLVLIGEALTPIIVRILALGIAIVSSFNRIPKPIRDFAVQMFAAVSAALVFVGGAVMVKGAIATLAVGMKAAGISVLGLLSSLWPVILALGIAIAMGAAFKLAFEKNLGGIADFFQKGMGKISLAYRALSQLFESGAFSGDVLKELEKGNGGVENFVIKIYLAAKRIENFFSRLSDGFGAAIDGAEPVFKAFVKALEDVEKAFGGIGEAIDPKAAGASFDEWGNKGIKVGIILGKVATVMIAMLTLALNVVAGLASAWDTVTTSMEPVIDAYSDMANTIIGVLVDLGILDKGVSGLGGAFKFLGQVVAYTFGNMGAMWGIVVGTFAGGFKIIWGMIGGFVNIIAGIFTGDWPRVWKGAAQIVYSFISGTTKMMFALVKGIAQMLDNAGKLVGKDLGLAGKIKGFEASIDADFKKTLGLDKDTEKKDAKSTTTPGATTPVTPPLVPAATPPSAPTAALGAPAPAASGDGGLAAAAKALQGLSAQPIIVNSTIQVEGETIGTASSAGKRSEAGRSFAPPT